jgi:ABC-type glycerol-3-phosphate transport system substrate-binding protein
MVLENAGGIYFQNGSFMSLLANLQSDINNASVLGIPSIDGRGPLASVGCSVAVSSQSPEQDGCLRFVETLLSPEIQEYYAYDTGYTPVNEAAFDSIAEQFVNDYNARMAVYETSVSPAELSMMNIDTARIETDVIDSYKAMIGTISGVESTDVAVDMIIREEIPAYFFGQKTIDEVIPVLEDRVQTFLDERD